MSPRVVMRRATRLAAAVGLCALLVFPMGAAQAAPPSGSFSGPAEGAVIRSGPPRISGEYAQANGIVTKVNLALRSLGGRGAPGASLEVAGTGAATLPFTWAPSLAYNGPYEVSATGTGEERPVDPDGPETSAPITRRFAMEVPPVAPSDVRTSVAKDTRFVRVTWRVNPEPDLVGYQVQRSKGGGAFTSVGETSSTSLVDETTASAGGEYRYRVVALRLGATDQNVITSAFSSTSTVQVAAPPTTAPPTTSPNDGGGDGAGSATTTTTAQPGTAGGGRRAAPVSGTSRIDLSAFAALLDQNRTVPTTPEEADGTFDPTLPFAPPTDDAEEPEDPGFEERRIPIQQAINEDGAADRFKNLAILAGGLLAFVVAMNLIYVLGEAHRAMEPEVLPTVDLEEEAATQAVGPSIDELVLAGAAATVPELADHDGAAPGTVADGAGHEEPALAERAATEPDGGETASPASPASSASPEPRSLRARVRAYVFGEASHAATAAPDAEGVDVEQPSADAADDGAPEAEAIHGESVDAAVAAGAATVPRKAGGARGADDTAAAPDGVPAVARRPGTAGSVLARPRRPATTRDDDGKMAADPQEGNGDAGGASTRVPPRSRGDRGEGRRAVRARR